MIIKVNYNITTGRNGDSFWNLKKKWEIIAKVSQRLAIFRASIFLQKIRWFSRFACLTISTYPQKPVCLRTTYLPLICCAAKLIKLLVNP